MKILVSQMTFSNLINALPPKITNSLVSLKKVAAIVAAIALIIFIYNV